MFGASTIGSQRSEQGLGVRALFCGGFLEGSSIPRSGGGAEDTPNRLMPFVGKDAAGKEDKVWLPGTWAPSLVNGSLQMLHYNFDESAYTAQLVGEPEPDSILVKRVEDGEVAKREAKISQRLTTFAGVGWAFLGEKGTSSAYGGGCPWGTSLQRAGRREVWKHGLGVQGVRV